MNLSLSLNLSRIISKKKTRSQMYLIATDDGRSVEREMPVLNGPAYDEILDKGWLIDPDNQFRDEVTGHMYQIAGERSAQPICLVKERKNTGFKGELKDLYQDSVFTEIRNLYKEKTQEKMRQMLLFILGTPIICATIVLAINTLTG
jgi:hypothetical protein